MSFDVFVQGFKNGEAAGISRERLRNAFGVHLIESEPDFWQLRYDDFNSCDIYLSAHDTDKSMVYGFTVNRPCADTRLWDALASILALGDIMLYFPGGAAPLVARSTVKAHLPPDMIEALGQPAVITTGNEILDAIHAA